MLEGECIRNYASENLIYRFASSASVGGSSGSSTDWTTAKTVTFTLASAKTVLIRLRASVVTASWNGTFIGNIRIRNGTSGTEVVANAGQITKTSGSATDYVYAYALLSLASGTYNFDLQYSYYWSRTGGTCYFYYLDEFRVGSVELSDVALVRDYSSSLSCPASTLTTLSTENVIPTIQRTIKSGHLKTLNSNLKLMVSVGTHTASTVPCRLRNVGDSDATTELGIKLYVDGTQTNWTTRTPDSTTTSTYALGCLGTYDLSEMEPPEELTKFDDDWSSFVGHGYVTVTDDTADKKSGTCSAKVYDDGTVGSVFYANFTSSDWSAYKGLSFWFKGQGDGTTITHWLLCPDWSNNLGITFQDTSTDWRLITIPFTQYGVGAGSPSLSTVASMLFYLDNGVTGNPGYFWFDRIFLTNGKLIEVKAENTNTTTARTVAHSELYATSPWLCTDSYNTCVQGQAITPQGSTLYTRLEALLGANPTKYLRFGRKRSCPNDSTDWEQTASSANIIDTSWTPTYIQIDGANVQAKGDWCIVSYIGVDTA